MRVRGGEVLGEFQTLVNPHVPIPAFIQVLTGITDAMVADAPRIEAALPAFLEFARGSVLVAHNAGFDISFLKAAAAKTGNAWPGFEVLDTVTLARQLVPRDEARNHKLSTLAALFGSPTTPDHRALHDARATVDVLHALIGRVGGLGVHTLEELSSYTSRVAPATRRKRYLARDLPSAPGVYMFKDGQGRVLYVGTSVNIRTRVGSYFTASEQRSRMAEMVRLAESVTPIVCATTLEAEVRELRLIAQHKPRYNRRSKSPERALWVKLTVEAFPRLSMVREVRPDGARYIGPFARRCAAEAAIAAVHEVIPLRQCVQRLSPSSPSVPAPLPTWGAAVRPAPGPRPWSEYAAVVGEARHRPGRRHPPRGRRAAIADGRSSRSGSGSRTPASCATGCSPWSGAWRAPSGSLPCRERADRGGAPGRCRRVGARLREAWPAGRQQHRPARRRPHALCPRAARHRRGRRRRPRPAPAATAEEAEKILRWLETPGVRIVDLDGQWTCPVGGAAAARAELEPQAVSRHATAGFVAAS